jgi:hypothetical protein
MIWTDSGQGPVEGCCEQGNEPAGYFKMLQNSWVAERLVASQGLGTAAISGLLYQAQMIDEGDCGAIGGIKIGRGNRSTRRKAAPAPLCPPQIPHDQNRARTRATNRLSYGAAPRLS